MALPAIFAQDKAWRAGYHCGSSRDTTRGLHRTAPAGDFGMAGASSLAPTGEHARGTGRRYKRCSERHRRCMPHQKLLTRSIIMMAAELLRPPGFSMSIF